MKPEKLFNRILRNKQNIAFNDFIKLIESFGFKLDRKKGSHHIFVHPDIKEIINIQNVDGQVKPYQINQFLTLVERYNLSIEVKR